jgi:hypothetical protein
VNQNLLLYNFFIFFVKENFAAWSRERDPEGKAWTWEGGSGRGKPLRFIPQSEANEN